MTILKSFKAKINGKVVNVEQVHLLQDRQSIAYRVNGEVMSANAYWSQSPMQLP